MQARTVRRIRHNLRCLAVRWLDRLFWLITVAAGIALLAVLGLAAWTILWGFP